MGKSITPGCLGRRCALVRHRSSSPLLRTLLLQFERFGGLLRGQEAWLLPDGSHDPRMPDRAACGAAGSSCDGMRGLERLGCRRHGGDLMLPGQDTFAVRLVDSIFHDTSIIRSRNHQGSKSQHMSRPCRARIWWMLPCLLHLSMPYQLSHEISPAH